MLLLPLRRASACTSRAALAALLIFALSFFARTPAFAGEPLVAIAHAGGMPTSTSHARSMGRLAAGTTVTLAFSLPLRNSAEMQTLISRLYNPHDPLYQHYLTQPEFAARFGPTPADYNAVIAFARSQGLSIVRTFPSRSMLEVAGPRPIVEAAFHTQLNSFITADGRHAHANITVPSLPLSIASKISGVIGLNTINLFQKSHRQVRPRQTLQPMIAAQPEATAHIGTGPANGLAPSDIKTAYNLSSVAPADLSKLTGQGQKLGLYELDGYDPADIQAYVTQFSLPSPKLINVLFGGFNGVPTINGNTSEVVLDIDMMLALAPNATIYVYEAPNASEAQITLYQKIADDNLAKSISTSFGINEAAAKDNATLTGVTEIDAETKAFNQMALQGQSMFAAAGDYGAYDDTKTISVDNPASNPFVTGVGGTTLTLNTQTQTYISETTWGDATDKRFNAFGVGGGGGISTLHIIPSYQNGIAGASATMRNVPDVSLNSDFNSGYAIYVASDGGFEQVGGTSAAAPLWAAFIGLVNEQRAKFGVTSTVGFLNPTIYNIYSSDIYNSVFHDINDGSDNLFYIAKKGYDNATGLGTFVGDQMLAELSPGTSAPVQLTGTVNDLNTGQLATGATIVITSLQIPGLRLTPSATTGTFTVTLDSLVTSNATSGKSVPITYNIAASQTGKAGDTQNIDLTQSQSVTLNISAADHTFSSGVLQMVSAPYDYTAVGDFTALFGLTPPLTGTGVNLISYAPSLSRYLYYPSAPADTFHPGQGYWAAFPGNAYIHLRGKSTPSGSFRIQLQQGWNQIGDPFTSAVTVSAIQVATLATTADAPAATPIAQSTLVQLPLYGYTPPSGTTAGAYYQVSSGGQLQPWQGYWIYANQSAVLIIPGS